MSNGSRFEINWEAVKELMLSSEMESALDQMSAGYTGDRKPWRSHDRVAIQVYRDNNDNNQMLKDLFGGENGT